MRSVALSLLLVACTGRGDFVDEPWWDTWRDTAVDVEPPDDTQSPPEGSRTLTLTTAGTWTLSPAGGPYTAVEGTLTHSETASGADSAEPTCELAFTVAGPAVDPGCEGCDATFTVTHTLTSGDPSACRSPDLPADGTVWGAGYHPSGVIRVDRGTGTWVALYLATRDGDTVTFGADNALLFQDP